jgi:hypothetical protein
VAIENLQIGDRLITTRGKARNLRWIGRRAYAGRFIAGNRDVLPILFRAGSLAEAIPARDLYVSPLHAMYLDGVLIPAWVLVNGTSIVQLSTVETVEYFHLELSSHDVILAEGAAAESFLDEGGRGVFRNAAEYRALYPGTRQHAAKSCAPRLESGETIDRVRTRLAARTQADDPKPLAAPVRSVQIISLLIPAGATEVPIGQNRPQGVVLAGERLVSPRWATGKLLLEPAQTARWCHIEVAPEQARRRA